MHALLFMIVLKARKNPNIQFTLLAIFCALIFSMRNINDYLRDHWKELGWTQNYFDESGLFLTVVVSGPIVILSILQTVSGSDLIDNVIPFLFAYFFSFCSSMLWQCCLV